jgi:photosystem II stability/assembly factor-like uncharacterized protein
MRSNTRAIRAAGLLFAVLLAPPGLAAEAQTAELMPLSASRALVLAFAETDSRAIAVGERGHVLVSESRTDWRQVATVPTRATLTAVTAVGERVWAVGHDGVILHSPDGGLSWTLQREDVWVPPAADDFDALPDPRQGAPLLDVLFLDADNGFAVGAYAMMLRTRDGGASWETLVVTSDDETGDEPASADEASDSWTFDADDLTLDAETDPHLNGIVRGPDGLLFVVAERGAVFRSRDDGQTWERQQLPYDGSMFGVLSLGEGHLLAYGLRGNMLESRDGGDSWQALDTGTELSLMGGANLAGGGWVVVGANGVVLHRAGAGSPLQRYTFENENSETPVLSAVLPLGARTLLVGGERGIGRFTLEATEGAQ